MRDADFKEYRDIPKGRMGLMKQQQTSIRTHPVAHRPMQRLHHHQATSTMSIVQVS